MDALVVSTIFGLGALLLFDALVRPEVRLHPFARVRHSGPAAAAAFGGGLVALVATSWPTAVIAAAIFGARLPRALHRMRKERYVLARREAIAEVCSRLRDSMHSGLGLSEALAHAANHAPEVIAADLKRLVSDVKIVGIADAAASFSERLDDPAADMFATALTIADRYGSRNLSEALDRLAESTAAHAATIREARARQTRARMSARIVAAIPLLLLLAIRRANPAYLAPYSRPAGQMILALAIVMVWAGYRAMRRAARIEEPTS